MEDSNSTKYIYSGKAFLWGAAINVAGIFAIKFMQYLGGLASFTDDVSSELKFTEILFWIWSPLALLSSGRDASLGFMPSPLFFVISAATMGVIASILYRKRERSDSDAKPEPNKVS